MTPISLELENFISHVHSTIDFTQFDSALVVGAFEGNTNIANGVGKSSIFDAIRFALYNKCRFSKKEKVVKRGKAQCRVEYVFELCGTTYKVVRTFNRKSGAVDVAFYKKDGDEWNHSGYTCDTPTATTAKIEQIIGMSHDTFVNSVYFRQNDISGFAGATASKRKEILKEVLQIWIWDEFQELAKKHEKGLSDQKLAILERLRGMENLDRELERARKRLAEVEGELQVFRQELRAGEEDLERCTTELVGMQCKTDLDRRSLEERHEWIVKRIAELRAVREAIKVQVKTNNDHIASANNDCALLGKQLVELAGNAVSAGGDAAQKARSILKEAGIIAKEMECSRDTITKEEIEHEKRLRELESVELQLAQLVSLKPGKECPTCLAELSNPADTMKRREARRNFLTNRCAEQKTLVQELSRKLKRDRERLRKAEEAAVEIERTEFIIAKRMAVMSEAAERNDRARAEFARMSTEWQLLQDEKSRLSEALSEDEDASALRRLVSEKSRLVAQVSALRDRVFDLGTQYGHVSAQYEDSERLLPEKAALEQQKERLSEDIDTYARVAKAFGKDGIQAIIMENVTEDLCRYTNAVLKNICSDPMSIDFITQKQVTNGAWKEDFDIVISMGNDMAEFEDLSGGEQVRIAIALRLGLSRLLMQRVGSTIKFLLLDEVDQTLDMQGIEALADAIRILSSEFKILVISHNEAMKEKFDSVITVVKGPGGSTVR
jgi:DNA repair exonuclease SbcCD ATPase subunit